MFKIFTGLFRKLQRAVERNVRALGTETQTQTDPSRTVPNRTETKIK